MESKSFFGSGTMYGDVRTRAVAIWRGPEQTGTDNLHDQYFQGWRNLSLEYRVKHLDQVECRTVYANLEVEDQEFAILRSIYWDGAKIRTLIKEQGNNFNLILPARFVAIPITQLKFWITELSDLKIPAIEPKSLDDVVNIKRLRIELDYIYRICEAIWKAQESGYDELEKKWNNIWLQMTQLLECEPIINGLSEDFWYISSDIIYDYDTYKPISNTDVK